MHLSTVFVASFALLGHPSLAQDPVVTLPVLGTIQGRTKMTVGNLGNTPREYYNFRNIPFANSIAGSQRFSQPTKLTTSLGTPGAPYMATQSGPLCPQFGLDPVTLAEKMDKTMESWATDILANYGLDGVIPPDSLLRILEDFLEVPVEGETIGTLLESLLDEYPSVAEDCLNLSVSTTALPAKDGEDKAPLLPVMFFIYGGGFISGTQYKMGIDRLGEVNDLVVVSTNYRLGPFGFMCVDSDDAAGNMGLLDQILALEWVQENIEYFGGDPNRVTIFGQSAGSASTSLLTLSPLTEGLFQSAIMESGSAISPWAYDTFAPDWHAHRIASKVGCDQAEDQAMVDCMRTKDFIDINNAAVEYMDEEILRGTLGFGGTNPCGQTAGARKVFSHGQNPQKILSSGQYNHIPMFGGVNKDEGLLLLGPAYHVLNDTMQHDTEWLKYEVVNYLMQTCGIDFGWSFTELITEEYVDVDQITDFDSMQDATIDLLGMLALKAPTYHVIEENSKHADSFFYSLEKRGRKTFHRVFVDTSVLPIPTWGNVMCAHADDLLYLFDVPLPLILCDQGEFFDALGVAWNDCVDQVGFLGAEACVTDHDGAFKAEWMECIDGHLTPEEQGISDAMTKAFSNFAVHGTPTPSGSDLPTLAPWSNENPNYIVFDTTVKIDSNYRKEWPSKQNN